MNRKPMTRVLAMLASLCLLAVAVGGAMLTQALEQRFGVSPLRAQPTLGDVRRFWEAQALEALSLAEEAELGRAVTEGADVPGAPNLRLRVFSVSEGEKRLIMDGADEDAWYIGQCRISFYRRTGAAALLDANKTAPTEREEQLVELYMAQPMAERDACWLMYRLYASPALRFVPPMVCGVALLMWLALLAWLCCAAGHSGADGGPRPEWPDRVPLELLLVAVWLVVSTARDRLRAGALMQHLPGWSVWALAAGVIYLLALSVLLSVVNRCKCGVLLRNTLLGCGIGGLRRLALFLAKTLPVSWQTAACTAAVLLVNLGLLAYGNAEGGFWMFLIFCAVLDGAFVLLALLYGWNLDKLSQIIDRIGVDGAPRRVDAAHMLPGPARMARRLGDVGTAFEQAVAERTRSERMKTELISNVSHDLKTPLTSLINYVDLLRRAETEQQREAYIDVLNRQAHRLKKLTEDLVEASKASSGAIAVELTDVSLEELLRQALAEYAQLFAEDRLELVMAPTQARVRADGKLLWRVLDNLLGNIHKYAMKGSRVYIDVRRADDRWQIAFKNISAMPLSVPGDELTERFVRGDSARNTEGSGLGLGIAQSLTTLMGGDFRVVVDGDLFKVELLLPGVFPED